jgi:NAD(P)-dependent dehydrogenase (short-subunit alcohol dehydrogenase family)
LPGLGAIVTGAGSGLGLAIAQVLAESGARVTLLDADAARVAAETKRLGALGYRVRGAVVDVATRSVYEPRGMAATGMPTRYF